MTEVISVKFRNKGKVYFFDPNGFTVEKGDNVIVETAKGLEFAECVTGNHQVDDETVHPPLRPVVRIATAEDVKRAEENRRREKEAAEVCRQRIAKHGLDMKLVDVEYNFEGSKILFFFTSEGRVDFRELVKELAGIFKTRIELRQIGVRDEARMLGGLGICGRPFCCAQFLDDFQPVSIKMAKTQGLSLNPTKISGSCGRLMCCLKYEQDAYEELVQSVPKVDAFVETPAGVGTVVDVNLLKGTVRVRLEDQSDMAMKTFDAAEVTVLGGKAKRAEYLAARAEGLIEAPPARLAPTRSRRQSAERTEPREKTEQERTVPDIRERDDIAETPSSGTAEGEKKTGSQARNRGGRPRQAQGRKPSATQQRPRTAEQDRQAGQRRNDGQAADGDQRRSQNNARRKRYRHSGPRRDSNGGQNTEGSKGE